APLELLPLLIPAVLYWWRANHLAQRGRPVPAWRQASFAAGLLAIALSLIGLGELSDELLWPHMLEHLLIGHLAAILLVLGLTGPLLQPILAIRPFDRLRVLAHPAVALPVWAVNLCVWHLPVLYERTLTSPPLHALEHGMFIFFGCVMWMPVLGPLPKPAWFNAGWKVIYVIVVRLASAVAFFAVFAVWAQRQLLESDTWTQTSTKLLADERVQTALDDFLVQALFDNVDVQAQLSKALPDNIQGLAGPAASGVRELA